MENDETKIPKGVLMFELYLAAVICVLFTFFSGTWAITLAVEPERPPMIVRQLIAGTWFFGVGAIFCLILISAYNFAETMSANQSPGLVDIEISATHKTKTKQSIENIIPPVKGPNP